MTEFLVISQKIDIEVNSTELAVPSATLRQDKQLPS